MTASSRCTRSGRTTACSGWRRKTGCRFSVIFFMKVPPIKLPAFIFFARHKGTNQIFHFLGVFSWAKNGISLWREEKNEEKTNLQKPTRSPTLSIHNNHVHRNGGCAQVLM